MTYNTQDIIFSDINILAGTTPEEKVINSDSINQNIVSIFETPVGSKWFRPEIGSDVAKYLFEPIDDITAERIKTEMQEALSSNGEFRVIFNLIEVIPDPQNEQYYVNIMYSAPELDNEQYTFTFNLTRGFG